MTTKAKRRALVAPADQPKTIRVALDNLSGARARLRDCGCKSAADYVARTMKSVEGALRHAERMAPSPQ